MIDNCIIFSVRGRIRNDLDVIDRVGGQLIEEIAELRSLEGARTTIDLDDDTRVAAQAHVIVDVDVHGGDIAQDVERGAAFGSGHVANDIARPIRLDLNRFALLLTRTEAPIKKKRDAARQNAGDNERCY